MGEKCWANSEVGIGSEEGRVKWGRGEKKWKEVEEVYKV